jgi:hypothetical protein
MLLLLLWLLLLLLWLWLLFSCRALWLRLGALNRQPRVRSTLCNCGLRGRLRPGSKREGCCLLC